MKRVCAACLALVLAVSARAEQPCSEAVLADLPILAASEPNRILIDLAPLGARPLRALLDTGASTSYATPRAARELGIGVRRLKSSPYRRKTLLGRDLQLLVDVASSDTASRTGWEYLFLGGDFLSLYVLEIDFHAVRVRFLDAERCEVPERSSDPHTSVLALRIHNHVPFVELLIAEETASFLLDTGAQGTLILSGRQAERLGVRSDAEGAVEAQGVYGSLRLEPATLERLVLGRFEERDVPVFVAPRGFHNQAGSGESVLGVEILRRFVVRIDYRRRRLWLHDPLAGSAENAAETR